VNTLEQMMARWRSRGVPPGQNVDVSHAIWIAVADLDSGVSVTAMAGPPKPHHQAARALVRVHGAPLGYVTVPTEPVATLTERIGRAANDNLASALQRHLALDGLAKSATPTWESRVACPDLFGRYDDHAGVSIVVCTRDRPGLLQDCLGSLLQVSYAPLEIVVVDNAPTDELTRKVVTELSLKDPRIRYACEPQPGLSRARNHGLAIAKFDLVAFTDDDVVVDQGWPGALAAGFAADPAVACVTGLVATRSLETRAELYFDSRYQWGEAFRPRRYDLDEYKDAAPGYPFAAGAFGTGANFAVRREVAEQLGRFDPMLGAGSPGRGGEDHDMFVRVILSGRRLSYLPSALVWHRHRADETALAEQVRDYGFGLGAYLAKRLACRELTLGHIVRGLGRFVILASRMRHAAKASDYKTRGLRLAASEARGMAAGALQYLRAAGRNRSH
jgi:glycosyltransferase involved in cell wall biosynthesis